MAELPINYDANTFEEAKQYLAYRYKQLSKFGFLLKDEIVVDNHSIVSLYQYNNSQELFGSIYILHDFRGKGHYPKIREQFDLHIVSFEECAIESYLLKKNIPYLILKHSAAYQLIQSFYGSDRTKRSQVPLIYHIEEGATILHQIGASEIVKDAYYIHPILQSDEAFNENKSLNFEGIPTEAIILSMEYRRVANSYLSNKKVDDFVGFSCLEVKQMLIADKVQNYKDFMQFHYSSHPRSKELYEYFHNWFALLEIDYADFNFL